MPTITAELADIRARYSARVRAFARKHGLTPNGLARLADVPEALVRGLNRPGWEPSFKTLERLDAVIPPDFPVGETAKSRRERIALDLTPSSLRHGNTGRITRALEIWNASGGMDGADVRAALRAAEIDKFCTEFFLRDDGEFGLQAQGDMIRMWGRSLDIKGLRVRDQPDAEYNEFVTGRLFRTATLGEPVLQACRAFCNIATGARTLTYWSLHLPLADRVGAAPTTVLSVCLPDVERRGQSYPGMS